MRFLIKAAIICVVLAFVINGGCTRPQENAENMEDSPRSIWFEGSNEIHCNLKPVEHSFKNVCEHYVGIIGLMPGMTTVELIEQGSDYVIIKTNEGLMKRTNISIIVEEEKIKVKFDEEYQAGKTLITNTHFLDEFSVSGSKVIHRSVISDLKAPGFMGFFYKIFGCSNIGKAFLDAYKNYLEK